MAATRKELWFTNEDFVGMQLIERSFLAGRQDKKATDGQHDDSN